MFPEGAGHAPDGRSRILGRVRPKHDPRSKGRSSTWQSTGLQNRRLGVRVPPALPRGGDEQTDQADDGARPPPAGGGPTPACRGAEEAGRTTTVLPRGSSGV